MKNPSKDLIEKIKIQLQSGLYTPIDLFLKYSYVLTLEQFESIVKENYFELVESMMQLQEIVYLHRQKLRVLVDIDQKYRFRIDLQGETGLILKDTKQIIENAGLLQKLYQSFTKKVDSGKKKEDARSAHRFYLNETNEATNSKANRDCDATISHILQHFAELRTVEADDLVVKYELYLQSKYRL